MQHQPPQPDDWAREAAEEIGGICRIGVFDDAQHERIAAIIARAAAPLREENEQLREERDKLLASVDELAADASLAEERARNGEVCNYENGRKTAYENVADIIRAAIEREIP